ncbi:suppressor of cytokine signaling 3 [Anomaloglossus baeobatrachus]|uniref:suppressor of cytokine signaling 3 n=1 Tax=Anomaloglossus baeobatrachus TaxID=238106 RepID=UPI003F4F8A29
MVTQSKFPSMTRVLDSNLRLRTFSSRVEYNLVLSSVHKLQESGFYWSTVSGSQANILLGAEPAGTFLIRDSSDRRHFFTLSVKTESGTRNLRIQCDPQGFSLQTDPRSLQPVPRFDCVLKLLWHYMASDGKRYYIYAAGERVPLLLSRPLFSSVSSLQHLCRKAVNGQTEQYGAKEQLPLPIQDFLQEYDSPV